MPTNPTRAFAAGALSSPDFDIADVLQRRRRVLTGEQAALVYGEETLEGAVGRFLLLTHGCASWVTDRTPAAQASAVAFDAARAEGLAALDSVRSPRRAPAEGLLAYCTVVPHLRRAWVAR